MDAGADSQQPNLSTLLAGKILARVRSLDLKPGDHLSEQKLADALRVSRTPIRLALLILQEKRIVEHRPNRGFFLAEIEAGQDGPMLLQEQERGDALYFKVAEDYLSGALPGKFYERDLMREYGITRTRTQQLLARISEEGWVTRLPGHGWQFLEVISSAEAYEQSFRFRLAIETAALLEPGYSVNPADFGRVRAVQEAILKGDKQKLSEATAFDAGASFHETIVAASGNPFYLDALRKINKLRRLMEYRIHHEQRCFPNQCEEHLQLLDLIEAGKAEEAAQLLRRHLQQAGKEKLARLPLPPADIAGM